MHQTSSSPRPPKHGQRHNFFSRSVPKLLSPQPKLQPEKNRLCLSSVITRLPLLFLCPFIYFYLPHFFLQLLSQACLLRLCTSISASVICLNPLIPTISPPYTLISCWPALSPNNHFLSYSLLHCGFNAFFLSQKSIQ